jgi:sugar phosphate isomerase/epimerase
MRFRDGMGRAIELAGRLSVPNLVFGSPLQRCIPDGITSEQARALAAETFHALGQQAASEGAVIAIEANPKAYGTNFLNSLEEASRFVADLGHPSIRLVLDLGEMLVNGTARKAASRISGLVATLSHVHVSEPHLAPAPADLGVVGPVLDALDASGYSGAVSIEMKRPQGGLEVLRQSLARLRAVAPHGVCK